MTLFSVLFPAQITSNYSYSRSEICVNISKVRWKVILEVDNLEEGLEKNTRLEGHVVYRRGT